MKNCRRQLPSCGPWKLTAPLLIFVLWQGTPIKWRGTSRRPIPENWHAIEQRSSPFHLAGNRNAAHPINTMLNYAYTVLESEVRIKVIAKGYDPMIGIMHDGRDGSSKFVFDLMEPERPKVDRVVLDFVKTTVFDPADFTIRSDGVVRLNPQLARAVVARVEACCWTDVVDVNPTFQTALADMVCLL
jgi:CRISP-associated protein Cas1